MQDAALSPLPHAEARSACLHAPRTVALPAAYAVSGACSLIYQLIWVKQLCLVFGSGFTAVSVVTAVFFLGLGLGGWLGGRAAARLARPLRAYGLAEAGIAVCALLAPYAMHLAEFAYGAWYPAVSASLRQTAFIRLLLSAGILLPPATLMGATVPFIIQAYARRAERLGGDTGFLYGMNALGAALGVLAAGWLLFRHLGLFHSNLLAAGLNAAVAVCALTLSRRESAAASPAHSFRPVGEVKSRPLLLAFAVSGFLYIGYELVWMRYFQLFFRDSLYLYAACIAAVILGTAMGGALAGRLADRLALRVVLGALFAAAPLLHGVIMLLFTQLHRPVALLAAHYPQLESAFVFAALLPPFVIMGGGFPVVARALGGTPESMGSAASKAYAVNTLGSLAASLGTPFVLLPALGLDGVMRLFLVCGLGCAFLVWLTPFPPVFFRQRALPAVLLAASLVVPSASTFFLKSEHEGGMVAAILDKMKGASQLVEVRQGLLGTNWAVKTEQGQTILYENLVAFSRGGSPSFLVQGFLPFLIMEKTPQRVLGLCFGGGLTYQAAMLFPEVQRLDVVDISSGNVDMALRLMEGNDLLRTDPRVRFHIDDAYSFVKYSSEKYNLIQIDSNPPFYSHNCATLYSREFYDLCRSHLAPGGLFTQVLPIKQLTHEEMRSILHTFSASFPHIMLWWNDLDPLMIGSNESFLLAPSQMAKRLERPAVRDALQRHSGEARYDSLGHFLSGLLLIDDDFRAAGAGGGLNSVDRNHLEYSCSPQVALDNVPWLERHRTAWADASQLLTEPEIFSVYEKNLEARRAFLFGLSQRRMMLSRLRL